MVYVNPVLAEEPLNLLYREEDSYRQVKENELQKSMDRKRYLYGLDLIEEYAPNKGSLLDIGCGTGLFLQTARERGWQVSGIEPNTWCYNHIMQMGIDVINTPIEQVEIPADSFDCITMWTVLEHIVDPAKILKSIHRALRKDGVLLVVVPNVDALANRILHEKSTTFAGESHVNLFSPATLTQLLQTAGFSRIHCETALSLLGTINNYLSYESPQFGNGTAVLDFLTPEYIHTNLLGYVLFALARVEKP
jgi:SAM-dependent methyltransferase